MTKGDSMKFKYKFTRTYLVEEKKFIQLLEEMSLKGWQLDEIKYNFLKFKTEYTQVKRSRVSFNLYMLRFTGLLCR